MFFPGYSDGNEDDDPPSDEPCLAKHPEVPKGLARSHLAQCFGNFRMFCFTHHQFVFDF